MHLSPDVPSGPRDLVPIDDYALTLESAVTG
jgi:hypothetical protein